MKAVGGDDGVGFGHLTGVKADGGDAVVLAVSRAPATGVHDCSRRGCGEHGHEIRSVRGRLGVIGPICIRCHERPVWVVETNSGYPGGGAVDVFPKPEPAKDSLTVQPQADAGPHLAEFVRLLEHVDVYAPCVERDRCRQFTDSAADDRDTKGHRQTLEAMVCSMTASMRMQSNPSGRAP